jgi:elongation factor G
LISEIANLDPVIEDLYLSEQPIPEDVLKSHIRKLTLELKFCPVYMGSAYKNKGVQLALDGVVSYLPSPSEKQNTGFMVRSD